MVSVSTLETAIAAPEIREARIAWLLALPAIVLLFLFILLPTAAVIVLGFTDFELGYSNWRFVDEKGAGFSVPVSGHIEVNSPTAAVRAAASGLGVAQVPAFIARSCLDSGRIVSILEDYLPTDRGIYAIYPHRRYLPAKVRHFVDYLKAIYNTPGYWEGRAGEAGTA